MSRKQVIPAEELMAIARERDISLLKQMFTLDGQRLSAAGFDAPQDPDGFSTYKMGRAWRTDKQNNMRMSFRFPFMGAYEMRVLHALIAAAMGALPRGCARYQYAAADTDDRARDAWRRLAVGEAPPRVPSKAGGTNVVRGPQFVGENISVISISRMQLLRILGVRYGAASIDALMRALDMLSETSFAVKTGSGLWAKTRLIGDIATGDNDRLVIVLNPRSAAAAMRMAGTYTMYSIDEMRRIRGDAALLLHAALSAFVNAGESTQISIENIMSRLWLSTIGGADRKAREALRQRRRTVEKAFTELEAVGWRCAEAQPGTLTITRPALAAKPRQKPLTFDQGLADDVGLLLGEA